MVEGGYYTGKDRMMMERFHLYLCMFPGTHGVMCRAEYEHLVPLLNQIFDRQVVQCDVYDQESPVRRLGGKKPYAYEYKNTSRFDIRPCNEDALRGTSYNIGYLTQGEECTEDQFGELDARIRSENNSPYNILLVNCNPDVADHYLNEGPIAESMTRIRTTLKDNPVNWDPYRECWTPHGIAYRKKLDRLPPVRRARARDGLWTGGRGTVFDFQKGVHLIPGFTPPRHWPRLCGIDWGWSAPSVCLWIAIDPAYDAMHIYRQIYKTHLTRDEFAAEIIAINNANSEYIPFYCCDPAEPAAIETFQQMGLNAVEADNDVSKGIDLFHQRMAIDADGRTRFYVHENSLVELDESLVLEHNPTDISKEFSKFRYATIGKSQLLTDKIHPRHDHGISAARYVICHYDQGTASPLIYGTAKRTFKRY